MRQGQRIGNDGNDLFFRKSYSQSDTHEERQGGSLPEGITEAGP